MRKQLAASACLPASLSLTLMMFVRERRHWQPFGYASFTCTNILDALYLPTYLPIYVSLSFGTFVLLLQLLLQLVPTTTITLEARLCCLYECCIYSAWNNSRFASEAVVVADSSSSADAEAAVADGDEFHHLAAIV